MTPALRLTALRLSLVILPLVLLAGCGSKISEANYYRVQYGMDEEAVDDLLGPAHREETPVASSSSTSSSSSQPAHIQKVKTWSRGGLTLCVFFQEGVVVGRRAKGIAHEDGEATGKTSMPQTFPAPGS